MAAAAFFLVTTVSLFAGEWMVRLACPQNLSGTWLVPASLSYSINKAGGTARHQSGGRVVHYRFNAQHLRGAALERTADWKVLCLGDSFTFGWLVAEKDCFVDQLHAKAAKAFAPASIEFLNGGTGGWGTANYTAFFEDYGEEMHADVVLVFLNFLDVSRSQMSGLFQWQGGDRRELQVAATVGSDRLRTMAQSIPGYQWLLEHSHLVQLARRACLLLRHGGAETTATMQSDNAQSGVELAQVLFRRLNQSCQRRGARLLVIAIGAGQVIEQVSPGQWSASDRRFAEVAPAFFTSINVPFIDLGVPMAAAVGSNASRYLIPVDEHFNEAGNALCAEIAWPWLHEQLVRIISASSRNIHRP